METTRISEQLLEELHRLGRAEKLRVLQFLVDDLADDDEVHETLSLYGNSPAVEALTGMLRDVDTPAKQLTG